MSYNLPPGVGSNHPHFNPPEPGECRIHDTELEWNDDYDEMVCTKCLAEHDKYCEHCGNNTETRGHHPECLIVTGVDPMDKYDYAGIDTHHDLAEHRMEE